MNTGGENAFESKGLVARDTVFHGPVRPSHIVLPILKSQ